MIENGEMFPQLDSYWKGLLTDCETEIVSATYDFST